MLLKIKSCTIVLLLLLLNLCLVQCETLEFICLFMQLCFVVVQGLITLLLLVCLFMIYYYCPSIF